MNRKIASPAPITNIQKAINKLSQKPTTGSSNNPNSTPSDISINEVHGIVRNIRPNLPEPEWYDVCKAIHNKSGGSDAGWRLFNSWSAGDFCDPSQHYPEHSERECQKKWDRCSLDKDHLVGFPRLKEIAAEYPIEKTRLDLSAFKKDSGQDGKGFKLTHVSKMLKPLKKARWLIDGILEEQVMASIFGESGTYKTFLALDWGLCIAAEIKWKGREVRQGPVIMIVGEGQRGIQKRIQAWAKANDVDLKDVPFYLSVVPAQFCDEKSAILVGERIRKLKKKTGAPVLTIVDTLARNFGPGDENSTKDMSTFIRHLDVYVGINMTRLITHHTGQKDKHRARGSYSFHAALDAEYETVKKEDCLNLEVKCKKLKDEEAFNPVHLLAEKVILKVLEDGESISSLILKLDPGKQITLTKAQKGMLKLLENSPLLRVEWKDLTIKQKVCGKTTWFSSIPVLEKNGFVEESNGYYRLST